MYGVLTAACLCLLVPWAGADVFSATARLQTLFEAADQVEGLLDNYIQQEEARLRAVRSMMTEVKSMRNRTAGEDVKFVEHPLGAFHFIKKYAQLHQRLEEGKENEQNLLTELERRALWIPTSEDLHGSASALLRLQRIYKISKMELLHGSIHGRLIDPLTLEDANLLANTAHEQKFFNQAIEWYDVSLRRDAPDPDVTLEQRRLSALGLINLYLQLNDFENAEIFAKWGTQVYPNDPEMKVAYETTMGRVENYRNGNSTLPPPAVSTPIDEHYAALCRGEIDRNNEYLSHGYCTVTTDSVPYRLVKQEVLSLDPFVAVFYDVLSETEARFFQLQARQNVHLEMRQCSGRSSAVE